VKGWNNVFHTNGIQKKEYPHISKCTFMKGSKERQGYNDVMIKGSIQEQKIHKANVNIHEG
jgi:hypothetical protein